MSLSRAEGRNRSYNDQGLRTRSCSLSRCAKPGSLTSQSLFVTSKISSQVRDTTGHMPQCMRRIADTMEAEERPFKVRKLGHLTVKTSAVQTATETELDLTEDAGERASRLGEQSDDQNDADSADSSDDGISLKAGKVPRPPDMSKNAWKKLQKKAEWEAGREFRKAKRKEKIQAKKIRDRAAKSEAKAEVTARPASEEHPAKPRARKHIKLPITFLIDCGFDNLMMEKERISLGSQLTRCYSDNNRARFQAHMVISSWGGLLKERFDTVLAKHHENWRGVIFTDQGFAEAAAMAMDVMKGQHGGELAGFFSQRVPKEQSQIDSDANALVTDGVGNGSTVDVLTPTDPDLPEQSEHNGKQSRPSSPETPQSPANLVVDEAAAPDGSALFLSNGTAPTNGQAPVSSSSHAISEDDGTGSESGEVVYLTSDSPHTLDELKPYSTYIIGGLVDKNRHKGICYKTACEMGLKTAKLPIGEFMEMQSRFVLATNHVMEIMVRWLDCGDWGKAFLEVIPKRKGGKLRESNAEEAPADRDMEHSSSPERQDKTVCE